MQRINNPDNSGCINKIPLNPPLQKGGGIGMPGRIEILRLIEVYHTLCDCALCERQ